MNRNGRSTPHFVTTSVQARAALWERLFGTVVLPVLHDQPRCQEIPGRGSMMAYDLDLRALHLFARKRLAAHVSNRTGQNYGSVWAGMETAVSWPIDAEGCVLVETAVTKRPSLLLWPTHKGMVVYG